MESVTDMRDARLFAPPFGAFAINTPEEAACTTDSTYHLGSVSAQKDLAGASWQVNTLSARSAFRISASEPERRLLSWLSSRLEWQFVSRRQSPRPSSPAPTF